MAAARGIGHVGLSTIGVLGGCLTEDVAVYPSVLVTDLSRVRYPGACGIGLLAFSTSSGGGAPPLVVRGASPSVRRVLSFTGMALSASRTLKVTDPSPWCRHAWCQPPDPPTVWP